MKRADEMRELFAHWKGSGLSLMAFGKKEGLSYSKLLYWKRKFRDDAEGNARADWAEVRVVPNVVTSAPEKFDVWLSNGVALEVPRGFDEADLRRLVGVLSSC